MSCRDLADPGESVLSFWGIFDTFRALELPAGREDPESEPCPTDINRAHPALHGQVRRKSHGLLNGIVQRTANHHRGSADAQSCLHMPPLSVTTLGNNRHVERDQLPQEVQ